MRGHAIWLGGRALVGRRAVEGSNRRQKNVREKHGRPGKTDDQARKGAILSKGTVGCPKNKKNLPEWEGGLIKGDSTIYASGDSLQSSGNKSESDTVAYGWASVSLRGLLLGGEIRHSGFLKLIVCEARDNWFG